MLSRGLPLTFHRGLNQSQLGVSPKGEIPYNATPKGTTQAISITADDTSTTSHVPFDNLPTRIFAAPLVTHQIDHSANSGNDSQKSMQLSRAKASSSFESSYTNVNVNAFGPFLGNGSMAVNSSNGITI